MINSSDQDREQGVSFPKIRGQVFLSYGHDPASAALVERISQDLSARGWSPWVDTKGIRFGDDWRGEITSAIRESEHMLAFLSRHSTRKPGVCRQEVAIALGPLKGHVYTVLVDPPGNITPPLIVSQLQWLDMHEWQELKDSDHDKAEELYRNSFAEILRVLEESRPFKGEIESLRQWLRPVDASSEMASAEKDFGGREWLLDGLVDEFTGVAVQSAIGHSGADIPETAIERFQKSSATGLLQKIDLDETAVDSGLGEIERWRRTDSSSRVFWLAAPPGWGKSAVAARLAHSARALVMAVHFCRHDQPDTCDARRMVRTLAFQMATQLSDYRTLLCRKAYEGETLDGKNALELFRDLVVSPLIHEVGGNRGREGKLLIVLDAIDETLDVNGHSEMLTLVASEFGRLPNWLGLVVTSRPESPVERQLAAYGVRRQSADDPRNLEDVRAYTRRWIQHEALPASQCERAVQAIMTASEGNFLYVRQLRDAVRGGALAPHQLTEAIGLPKGLASLYERWFLHRFPDISEYRRSIRPLFDLMIAARELLPVALVSQLLDWGRDDKAKILKSLGSLCITETDRLRLFHRSLHEWLERQVDSGPDFSASATDGHLRIAATFWRAYLAWQRDGALLKGGGIWAQFGSDGERYAMANLPAHLAAAGLSQEHHQVLMDFAFAMRRASSGQVDALIADHRDIRAAQPAEEDDGLSDWSARIVENEHLLRQGTSVWQEDRILLQIAVEGPENSSLTRAAEAWTGSGGATWPWMYRRFQGGPIRPSACLHVFVAPADPVRDVKTQFRSLALAAGGGFLVAGTGDGRVFEMDRSTNRIAGLFRQHGTVACLVASPQGDRFASLDANGEVFVWSKGSSEAGYKFAFADARFRDLAFSADGGHLACAFSDGRIRLWALEAQRWVPWGAPSDVASPMEIDCGRGDIVSIAWASEARILVTVRKSGEVLLWRTSDGQFLGVLKPEWPSAIDTIDKRMTSVALNKDGRVGVVGSAAGLLWVFHPEYPGNLRSLPGHSGPIYSVAITPSGGRAVSGGHDKTVRIWNLDFDDELEAVLGGHDHLVTKTMIDPSGDVAYSASTDGTLRVWDRKRGRALQVSAVGSEMESPKAEVTALANGPEGMILAGYKSGHVGGLDASGMLQTLIPPLHAREVWAITQLSDSRCAVSASWDGVVSLWNTVTGKVEVERHLPLRRIYGLRCTNSGRIYCWGERTAPERRGKEPVGGDATAIEAPGAGLFGANGSIFELTPSNLSILPRVTFGSRGCTRALSLSSDERIIFAGGQGGMLAALDAEVGSERWSVQSAHPRGVYAMSLTPNGARLATGGADRVIRIWDSRVGRLLLELPGHLAAITSLDFAEDGVRLVSASWDGTVRIWDTRERCVLIVAHVPGVSKTLLLTDGRGILAGTTRGEILMLDLVGMEPLFTSAKR